MSLFVCRFCTEVELPMAEDWSICIKVGGTEPGLAPHRYFDWKYLNTQLCLQEKCWVGTIIPVYTSLFQYISSWVFSFFFYKWYDRKHVCHIWQSECAFVYPGSTLLTGSSSLQLWSNADGVKDEAEEVGTQTEMTIRDCHSAWRCIWQSK